MDNLDCYMPPGTIYAKKSVAYLCLYLFMTGEIEIPWYGKNELSR